MNLPRSLSAQTVSKLAVPTYHIILSILIIDRNFKIRMAGTPSHQVVTLQPHRTQSRPIPNNVDVLYAVSRETPAHATSGIWAPLTNDVRLGPMGCRNGQLDAAKVCLLVCVGLRVEWVSAIACECGWCAVGAH